MVKKQTKDLDAPLKKILTIAGIITVIVGCIANAYGAYTNWRFVLDALDAAYYLRYIIILAGGFAVGYVLTKKPVRDKLFHGSVYAALAYTLYYFFDLIRFGWEALFGYVGYPWSKIVFNGIPLVVLIALIIFAVILRTKHQRLMVGSLEKLILIVAFAIYQVFSIAIAIYFAASYQGYYPEGLPIWVTIASYLSTAPVIAIVSFLVLSKIKSRFNRAFYSVLIATLCFTLSDVLWEFRTDPSSNATNIFSAFMIAIIIIFAGVLVWRSRVAIKK